ncbi:MAG: type II toxin-antitoxin system YafQ family toxin [Anaerolineae bacterium]|nr:type II toxin-antitoxin system YafQ family toxin [Anaerolineae bacterium]
MTRTIRRTSQFKRDVRHLQRAGKDLLKLKMVLESLVSGEEVAPRYRDHVLVGQYKGTRECHLEPDWLLIYELAESELVLIRTGSHSDLFR